MKNSSTASNVADANSISKVQNRCFFYLDSGGKRALLWIIGCKLVFWLLAAILVVSDNKYKGLHLQCIFPWPRGEEIVWASRLATWDAGHYLGIAAVWAAEDKSDWVVYPRGKYGKDDAIVYAYADNSPRCAYYPLWPALLTPASGLFGEKATFFWGLLLANALSVLALWILYGHFREQCDGRTALLAILLMLAIPGAIFFSLIYTESLFLFLAALALRALSLKRYKVFGIVAFLLSLTKAIGFFILIAAVVYWMRMVLASKNTEAKTGGLPYKNLRLVKILVKSLRTANSWRLLLSLLLPAIRGYAFYFAVMWRATGNPFEGFEAQQYYANRPSVAKIFDWTGFTKALVRVEDMFHPTEGLLDRVCFVWFVFGIVVYAGGLMSGRQRSVRTEGAAVVGKGFHWEDFWWMLAVGIIPALSNQLLSYTRFLAVCFPVFLGVAYELQHGVRSRWMTRVVLWISIVLQGIALLRYLRFEWVG